FQPVKAGHGKIGDEQIRRPRAEGFQTRAPVIGNAHLISCRFEAAAQDARDLPFIVNHQDLFEVIGHELCRLSCRDLKLYASAGSVRSAFNPDSSPMGLNNAVRDCQTQAESRLGSGAIPMPWSQTAKEMKLPPPLRTLTSMGQPAGEYLDAFSISVKST